MINELVLVGRLGRDPIVGESKNGTKIIKFSLPLFHSYSPEGKKDEWLQCEAWSKLGNIVEKAQKGTLVAVRGELHNESWKDNEGNWKGRSYLKVDSFRFLEKKKTNEKDKLNERPEVSATNKKTEDVIPVEIEPEEKQLDDIDEFLNSL